MVTPPAGSRGQRPAGSRGQPQPREATARLDTPPSGSGPPAPGWTRHLRDRDRQRRGGHATGGIERPAPGGIESASRSLERPAPGWSRHRRDREASARRDREASARRDREASRSLERPPPGWTRHLRDRDRQRRPGHATFGIGTASAGVVTPPAGSTASPGGIERPAAASRGHRPAGHATGEIERARGGSGPRSELLGGFPTAPQRAGPPRTASSGGRPAPPRQDAPISRARGAGPSRRPLDLPRPARSLLVPRFLGIEAKNRSTRLISVEMPIASLDSGYQGACPTCGTVLTSPRPQQGEASGR